MLSRVVETIYWTARYVERAEDMARLINVNSNLLLDLPRGIAPGWAPLLNIIGCDEEYRERYDREDERQVLRYLIGDLTNPSSIAYCVSLARDNARTIRDVIPRDAWHQINSLHLYAKDNLATGLGKRGRFKYLTEIIQRSQLLTGTLTGSMLHDEGYVFLRIGRNLERADMTTRILDVRSASLLDEDVSELRPFDNIQWMSVLQSLSGYQMYRREMQVQIRRAAVLKFLLHSVSFPRAVLHCFEEVGGAVAMLPNSDAPTRAVSRAKRTLRNQDPGALAQESLHEFVDCIQVGISEIHDELSSAYFLNTTEGTDGQSQSQSA